MDCAFIRQLALFGLAWLSMAGVAAQAEINSFLQTNLVSDQPGLALRTDPNLVNPWGISYGGTGPFWVSDNQTGLSTLYNGSGVVQGLVVSVPAPSIGAPPSAPTGQVNVSGLGFNLTASPPSNPANFVFATEDGTISAWRNGTAAVLKVDNTDTTANSPVFKGLAVGSNGGANFLYAADFRNGVIDVFNQAFTKVASGGFVDPGIPAGFAPFNIQNLNGTLYVTYAKQDVPRHDDVPGVGFGYVDAFKTDGTFLGRIASTGLLNSPWGLAIAPSTWGRFSNDLLVGNFGDGKINAFDLTNNNAFVGQLNSSADGNPLAIDGLWALIPGNNGNGGSANNIFFSAGPNGETHGLFGVLADVGTPEPSAALLGGFGGVLLLAYRRLRGRTS